MIQEDNMICNAPSDLLMRLPGWHLYRARAIGHRNYLLYVLCIYIYTRA